MGKEAKDSPGEKKLGLWERTPGIPSSKERETTQIAVVTREQERCHHSDQWGMYQEGGCL